MLQKPLSRPLALVQSILFSLIILGAALSPAMAQAGATEKKSVAIFTANVNVDGTSYKKGIQAEVQGYDRISGKVTINDQGKTSSVPSSYVRIVPQDQAGITVIEAKYGVAGERTKNVTSSLQQKLDGQQKVSLVVSGDDYGVKSQPTPPKNLPNIRDNAMRPPLKAPATLTIEYCYNGTHQTASAPEGQTISMPQ